LGKTTTAAKVHALFGSPIDHSLSPIIFNGVFEKLSVNRVYLPFDISSDKLSDAVGAARTLGFAGFNVTIPHKTRILELLDQLDGSAKEKGSVNTVACTDWGLVGYNTDGEGALRALKSYGFNPSKKRILVIGAGGSARSLVHSLAPSSSLVVVLNRTQEKAREIADKIQGGTRSAFGPLTKNRLEEWIPGTDLLVNATPLQTPTILAELGVKLSILRDVGWVFDLAYDKPAVDVPSKQGRVSPLEMLLQQAALSYEIWLGKPAPLDLMRSAMTSHLGGDWR
jgi:shikimate dehydrogenase